MKFHSIYEFQKFDHVRELNYEQYKDYAKKIFTENFDNQKDQEVRIQDIEEKYWELCHQNLGNY